MASLIPTKLHTRFTSPTDASGPLHPRCYTLTHSDRTGDLFLTVASEYDRKQISGWYTRLMRDEILATWQDDESEPSLHVHCHVSGGIVLGSASWRENILRQHMQQVLEAFHYGDRALTLAHPKLNTAKVCVHFHTRQEPRDRVEAWGVFGDYELNL